MSEEEKKETQEETPEKALKETQTEVPEETPQEPAEPYVLSPKWKRVLAWVLFGIACLGIILWLLGIARPEWIDTVKSWFR